MVATALQPHLPGRSSTSNTASTANAAQASTLETQGAQPTASERQRVSDLQEQFQQQARQDPAGFRSAMREAFGDKASLAQIDQLLDMALAGKLPMPANIQFVEAGSLGSGALGAYDANNGGSLYLDRSLLSDPEKLESVFNEEMGHHLDALLGGADAAGDEGAVFSQTLEQGTLSQSELTALRSENDHGYITVDGKIVAVEFRNEDEGSGNGQSPSPSPSPGTGSGGGGPPGTGGGGPPGTGGGSPGTGGGGPPGTGGGGPPGTGGGGPPGTGGGGPPGTGGGGPPGTGGGGPPGTGGGGPPGTGGGPPEGDNRDDDTGAGGNKPPSEEDTERALSGLGNAGTAVGALDALNQKAGNAAKAAGVADDIVGYNKAVSAAARGLGHLANAAAPVVAAVQEGQRARSEGADQAEQRNRAARAGIQQLDNVGAAMAGAAAGSPAGPFGSVIGGAVAADAYTGSEADMAFDETVDTVVEGAQSSPTRVPAADVSPAGTVNQGWSSFNRTR